MTTSMASDGRTAVDRLCSLVATSPVERSIALIRTTCTEVCFWLVWIGTIRSLDVSGDSVQFQQTLFVIDCSDTFERGKRRGPQLWSKLDPKWLLTKAGREHGSEFEHSKLGIL